MVTTWPKHGQNHVVYTTWYHVVTTWLAHGLIYVATTWAPPRGCHRASSMWNLPCGDHVANTWTKPRGLYHLVPRGNHVARWWHHVVPPTTCWPRGCHVATTWLAHWVWTKKSTKEKIKRKKARNNFLLFCCNAKLWDFPKHCPDKWYTVIVSKLLILGATNTRAKFSLTDDEEYHLT